MIDPAASPPPAKPPVEPENSSVSPEPLKKVPEHGDANIHAAKEGIYVDSEGVVWAFRDGEWKRLTSPPPPKEAIQEEPSKLADQSVKNSAPLDGGTNNGGSPIG